MGTFIQCIKTEYNIDHEGITDDNDDETEYKKNELEKEKEMEILPPNKEVYERAKTQININDNTASLMHYDENFLFNTDDGIQHKRSNSFLPSPNPKNIL